jgi:hypothetical protein
MPEIAMRMEVRDLGPGDLESCGWAGTATHLAAALPAGVALLPTRPALLIPTGLAVPDPARRPLTGEFLTAAHTAVTGARLAGKRSLKRHWRAFDYDVML